MVDVNKKLRAAARSGSEVELKVLLNDSGCDVLPKDKYGWTAMMWAAGHGQEACVELLLPSSDALSKDNGGMTALMWTARHGNEACVGLLLPTSDLLATDADGRTASVWALNNGHESLGQFVDAYVLAQSERAAIGSASSPGVPRGRDALRV